MGILRELNQPAILGDSIEPGVERSGTPGQRTNKIQLACGGRSADQEPCSCVNLHQRGLFLLSLPPTSRAKRVSFLEVTELTEAAYPSNQGWFDELIHPNHMGHRLIAAELLELLSAERLTTGLTLPALTP
jgi:hypothetical protein